MFAKQTIWSASLVALCGAAAIARAEDDPSAQPDDEVRPPSAVEPSPPPRPAKPAGPVETLDPEPRQLPHDPPPGPIAKPSGRFAIGAGFSSDDGFLASATLVQPDLFRTGSLLMMHAQVSARRQLFLTRFADPDVLDSPLGLSFDLYSDRRTLPGFIREGTGAALTASYRTGHIKWFLGYRLEHVEVESTAMSAARSLDPLPPLTGGLISSVRAGMVYDTTDGSAAPLRGTELGTSLEIADRRLGSDLQFTKADSWLRHHQPIGPLTLHLAGSYSAIWQPIPGGGFASAPRSERLFLMSSHEIRGYRPDSFGPVDALGTPVGGDAKILGSVELEVPLVRRLGLSAFGFADAGGLLAEGQSQLGLSAGFGLLWRSPIGPLKFSWALPVDGKDPVFVFGIGSGF